jgi:hypothetical protein
MAGINMNSQNNTSSIDTTSTSVVSNKGSKTPGMIKWGTIEGLAYGLMFEFHISTKGFKAPCPKKNGNGGYKGHQVATFWPGAILCSGEKAPDGEVITRLWAKAAALAAVIDKETKRPLVQDGQVKLTPHGSLAIYSWEGAQEKNMDLGKLWGLAQTQKVKIESTADLEAFKATLASPMKFTRLNNALVVGRCMTPEGMKVVPATIPTTFKWNFPPSLGEALVSALEEAAETQAPVLVRLFFSEEVVIKPSKQGDERKVITPYIVGAGEEVPGVMKQEVGVGAPVYATIEVGKSMPKPPAYTFSPDWLHEEVLKMAMKPKGVDRTHFRDQARESIIHAIGANKWPWHVGLLLTQEEKEEGEEFTAIYQGTCKDPWKQEVYKDLIMDLVGVARRPHKAPDGLNENGKPDPDPILGRFLSEKGALALCECVEDGTNAAWEEYCKGKSSNKRVSRAPKPQAAVLSTDEDDTTGDNLQPGVIPGVGPDAEGGIIETPEAKSSFSEEDELGEDDPHNPPLGEEEQVESIPLDEMPDFLRVAYVK